MKSRMIVTGASGFVGRQLVPQLSSLGFELLLVGRDPGKLQAQFPGMRVCQYSELAEEGAGYETLVHLAVLNNNTHDAPQAYEAVNVGLLQQTLESAKIAGVQTFVNMSTFHAFADRGTPYSNSKSRALEVIARAEGITAVNLFLPAVYGDVFAGKLAFLGRLPTGLGKIILRCLSALMPTIHVNGVAQFLAGDSVGKKRDHFLFAPQERNTVYRFTKRFIDFAFAFSTIVFLSWLFVLCWVWIRLDSRGPAIFAQERVGRGGKVFTCYKFRTMHVGVKQAGTHELSASSVTTAGAILRKTKLDELPQVANLLRGEMSLVGPRPCLPVQSELIQERSSRSVLDVLPGITGLAQVAGVDMSDPVKLAALDQRYVAMRGLVLDLKIIVRTFLGGGSGDRVGN